MVAYNFKRRFAEPIIAGEKRQTIRANRTRHARPGESLQLYTGMRTRRCYKILPVDPVCAKVSPVVLQWELKAVRATFVVDGRTLSLGEMHLFAVADGFRDLLDMAEFWNDCHGSDAGDNIRFDGLLITWRLSAEN